VLKQQNGWTVQFKLTQNGTGLSGTCSASKVIPGSPLTGDDFAEMRGTADGTIIGDHFEVNAYWAPDKIGAYSGTVNPQGRVEGNTTNRNNPGETGIFYSDTFLSKA
jgi:hypothetical protein